MALISKVADTVGEHSHTYFSYLLRLWQVKGENQTIWRASLESAQTRKRHYFTALEDLVRFLYSETAVCPRDFAPK